MEDKQDVFLQQLNLMTSNKNKTIENYVIEDQLFTQSDQSQFFSARHTVLKKTFTLRKIDLSHHSDSQNASKNMYQLSEQAIAKRINAQIRLLKHLNGVGCPRCHKVIKSSHNLYIIYDSFPSKNLKQYLFKNIFTKSQKLQLMIKIAETLKEIHKKGVAMVKITLQNIRIDDNQNIIFSDLSLSCLQNQGDELASQLLLSYPRESFPKQLDLSESYDYSTDVLMLGKLFEQMLSRQMENLNEKYKKIQTIIKGMQEQPGERLSLKEVILELEELQRICLKERNFGQKAEGHSLLAPPPLFNQFKPRKYSMDQTKNEREIYVTPKQALNPKKQNQVLTTPFKEPAQKKKKSMSSASTSTKSNFSNFARTTVGPKTLVIDKQNVEKVKQAPFLTLQRIDHVSRNINKIRNLAFFIVGLSQFVMKQWICPELGYLLLKYANLTLNDCLQKLEKEKDLSPEHRQLLSLIIGEKSMIAASQAKMRQIFLKEAISSDFRWELEESQSINNSFLINKIIEFARTMMNELDKPSKERRSVPELTDIYAMVYMLLKKIEMRSYEQFWESIYNMSYASLSRQKYLQDERQLGLRYLKSKVNAILDLVEREY